MSLLPDKDDHVYSYTQLSTFDECPFAFYMSKIEKSVEPVGNGFAEQGSLVHDLIDKWAKGELSKDELAGEYECRYPLEVVTPFPAILASKGYDESTFLKGLDYFLTFDEFRAYEIIDTETQYITDLNGRKFTGIIDMLVKDKKTGDLIIIDHKSKSLSSFRKAEKSMYRQLYMYSKFVYEKYGKWPDKLMFNLFKENGTKKSIFFKQEEYDETMRWATDIIEKIESYDTLDWLQSKETKDFYCLNLCDMRKGCYNGY